IFNMKNAQSVFGTPFGNMPRNSQRDAITNIANLSVFKNFKLGERSNLEIRGTALNALNHFNFGSIIPDIDNAGLQHLFGHGYADPSQTAAAGRVVWVGGIITF